MIQIHDSHTSLKNEARPPARTNGGRFSAFKLAAVDLDGTLLGPNKKISRENASAIEQLKSRGVEVVLASGRKHDDILRFHEELGLSSAILSCHGALVKEPHTERVISRRLIAIETVSKLVDEALTHGLSWAVYDENGVHLQTSQYWLGEYIKRTDFDLPIMYESVAHFTVAHAEKVNWMGDPGIIRAVFDGVNERYGRELTCVITDPDHLEFTVCGADKASGLADLAAHLNVAREEIIAFGDSNNDVTMLAWAGLGVAMSHGTEAAIQAASMISPHGDEATSLARAVERIFN